MCKRPSTEPSPQEKVKAVLYLEDGTTFEGYSFGAAQGIGGEVGTFFISCPLKLYLQHFIIKKNSNP